MELFIVHSITLQQPADGATPKVTPFAKESLPIGLHICTINDDLVKEVLFLGLFALELHYKLHKLN